MQAVGACLEWHAPTQCGTTVTQAGRSVHKTCVEATGRGPSRLPRPRPEAERHVRACMSGRGQAEAEAGVIGRDQRPRQACFVQG
eukprot:357392-Chlamydomonas_euryale.AAC.40